METNGILAEATTNFQTGKRRLTFEVDNVTDEEINRLAGCEVLDIKAVRHTERRSLSSNAYFHVLCSKIADALTISKARAKNDLLTKYGQPMYLDDGNRACIKTNITIEQAQEMEEPHLKFHHFKDEDETYFYIIYRGSHTYNSAEMSRLIDGTIADAKELGIETMPPEELSRMLAAWKPTT